MEGDSMFKNKEVTKFMDRSINYSACNEDSNSEELFFQFQGKESLLCLLGGGERFFNLLTYENACGFVGCKSIPEILI